MIINSITSPSTAQLFDIIDSETLEDLGRDQVIWYADDEIGMYKAYRVDGMEVLKILYENPESVPSTTHYREIEIVPRIDLPDDMMERAKGLIEESKGKQP